MKTGKLGLFIPSYAQIKISKANIAAIGVQSKSQNLL